MELHKTMFPDSQIAAQMALKRKKCASLVQLLGNHVAKNKSRKLRSNKFSLIIDETTDISVQKACALIVKYFDRDEGEIKTAMLDIISVYDGDTSGSSGESLFKIIINCLNSLQIPLSNMIGFAADGASNIMGSMNSVTSRLKQQMPGITIFRCVSHSIHLCSSAAAKTLPQDCEDLMRNVYNFFSHSAKRKFEFKEYQLFCQVKPHKLLHPCATRWVSLQQAVDRVIEQWQSLKVYFDKIWIGEKLSAVQSIHEGLHNRFIFAYLAFMNYILPQLNSINLIFQSKGPTLHLLHDKMSAVYRLLLNCFCYSHIISHSNINDIDPANTSFHKPLNQIYLGVHLHELFQKPEYHMNDISLIRTRCRIFLIEACNQIKKRFDMNNKLWKLASYLHPKSVLSIKVRDEIPSLSELFKEVPRINDYNMQEVDDQWRAIPYHHFPEEVKELQSNAGEFLKYILKFEDRAGNMPFNCFGKFALEVLSLPCSNADA